MTVTTGTNKQKSTGWQQQKWTFCSEVLSGFYGAKIKQPAKLSSSRGLKGRRICSWSFLSPRCCLCAFAGARTVPSHLHHHFSYSPFISFALSPPLRSPASMLRGPCDYTGIMWAIQDSPHFRTLSLIRSAKVLQMLSKVVCSQIRGTVM